jgi:hypothetical protein
MRKHLSFRLLNYQAGTGQACTGQGNKGDKDEKRIDFFGYAFPAISVGAIVAGRRE